MRAQGQPGEDVRRKEARLVFGRKRLTPCAPRRPNGAGKRRQAVPPQNTWHHSIEEWLTGYAGSTRIFIGQRLLRLCVLLARSVLAIAPEFTPEG